MHAPHWAILAGLGALERREVADLLANFEATTTKPTSQNWAKVTWSTVPTLNCLRLYAGLEEHNNGPPEGRGGSPAAASLCRNPGIDRHYPLDRRLWDRMVKHEAGILAAPFI